MLNRLLVVLFIMASIGIFGYANVAGADNIVEPGLVSYWSFNSGTVMNEVVSDIMGVHDGAIFGLFEPAVGKVGQGLRNATEVMTNYAQVNINSLLGPTTITVWAMGEAFTGTHYVFGHTTLPTWNNRIQLYSDNDGQLDLGLGDSHTRHVAITPLEIGTWYHIALAYKDTPAGDYQVYINGDLKAEGTFTGLSDQMGFADIANDGAETGRDEGWIGVIDEFCLYNRVLTADEIQRNYQASGFAVFPSGKLGAAWGKIKTEY